MANEGYRPNYLGEAFVVELPTITAQYAGNIVRSETLRDGHILDYLNYSVVMNSETRQAFYSAANVDFNRSTGDGRNFRIDRRIDECLQLDNIYYKDIGDVKNPYDRGHLTRRDAIAWGNTKKDANKASRDSCYFTNVSLQHENFNQDEWYALEKAIEDSLEDADNRFDVFTGPVFTEFDRFIIPEVGLPPARIPGAFWKIIMYISGATEKVEVNAFLVFQDNEAIRAKRQVLGNNEIDPFFVYQTSTTLIEVLTGIEFPLLTFDNNPMFFFASERTRSNNIDTPQLHRVTPLVEGASGIIFEQNLI